MDTFSEVLTLATEDPAHVDEAENHWIHFVKVIIVVCKVIFISVALTFAICAYKSKSQNLPNRKGIIALLSFKICILLGLMALDFTTQYITAFFLLGLGSCFCTFATLQLILGNVQTESGRSVRRKYKWYGILMVMLYITTCGMAFSYKFGAFCNHTTVYPLIMQAIPILFAINASFAIYLKSQNYGLTWDDKENFLLHADSKNRLQDLFESQMKTYICYQYVVAFVQIVIFCIGRWAVGDHHEYLGCYDGGWEWKYHSVLGSLFTFLLIASCFMQAILLEKVFYEIPKHMGFFDVQEVGKLAGSIRPKGSKETTPETQDDAFLNANTLV